MAFDAKYAREIALPLVVAAYDESFGRKSVLPASFEPTAQIAMSQTATRYGAALSQHTSILGLMASNADTAVLAFRGSETLDDWLQDFEIEPEPFIATAAHDHVADGFQDVFLAARQSIATALSHAGTKQILITGHSLGGAVAILAALDIRLRFNTESRVITFGGPRVGLHDFALTFNAAIESCFRVVNSLDIVPHVPPAPFVHVGSEIRVNGGGSLIHRHLPSSYAAGLAKL
jgi:predicted lipase